MYAFILIIVTIVWGSTFFIIKNTVENTNEYLIVFARTFIPSVIMLSILFFKNVKNLFDKKIIKNGIILGTLLAIIYITQTIGLKYTSSGHSAFITGTAVIIVPIILFLFFKENITTTGSLSIITVLIGLLLLTYDFDKSFNIGDIITLITAFAHAAHIVLAGKFVKKTDALTLITYQFLIASAISLSIFLLTNNRLVIPEIKDLYAILYLGIIGTLFCYFVSVWIQKYVDSIKVVLYFSLEPLFAAIFGYLMLSETLNTKELFGALLILGGVIFYQLTRRNIQQIYNEPL